CMQDIELPLTF
nr:immunoglobulin light chain junction region [Macaca mulatta]MOW40684.1 immunoglobulin light chain junction region [Macaca mulatta]MOW41347.1 immunoglobulin light chain junction region [Macaca mulatta]MOW41884.1 immunoglobulin light chain junction region [Macaca mulatta]MOW42142.1 immunoglobulin light chain junction region [Macaca mulatta]